MRNLFYLIILLGIVYACSGDGRIRNESSDTTADNTLDLVVHKFKIEGIQDSIIADSIWKMIFQVKGIDKLVLSKNDCTAFFTVDPDVLGADSLREEIVNRGGMILH